MLRILSILLLSLLTCIGSDPRPFTFSDQAFLQAALPSGTPEVPYAGYPTNIEPSSCYAWYVVDNHWSSSSGLGTLTNLCSNITNASSINLTNLDSGTGKQPTLSANYVGTNDALYFDGVDDYLRNVNFTNPFPIETWMVVKKTNYLAPETFHDSAAASPDANRNKLGVVSASYLQLWNNSGTGGVKGPAGMLITNAVYVLTSVANGASSLILTNNVTLATGDAGTITGPNGLTIGSRRDQNEPMSMFFFECIVWTAALTSTERSNVFNYLTNKYAITVP